MPYVTWRCLIPGHDNQREFYSQKNIFKRSICQWVDFLFYVSYSLAMHGFATQATWSHQKCIGVRILFLVMN